LPLVRVDSFLQARHESACQSNRDGRRSRGCARSFHQHIEQALQTMREHRVRRLPVLNLEGELEGILSMNDIVLKAKQRDGKKPQIDYADVVKTYQAICEHPVPIVQTATAT
jgi:CBS-domain-containing membrane protein